jgi:PAS domain S-box-containing protein
MEDPNETGRDEATRLRVLRSYQVLDTAPESALDELTCLAARLCGTPMALITLVDGERLWLKSRQGLELSQTAREHSFCEQLVRRSDGAPLVVPDATKDEHFRTSPFVTQGLCLRFYAGAPLVNPEGHVLGALCVLDREPRDITPEQLDSLRVLARQVVHQLESRRLNHTRLRLADALRSSEERFDLLQNALTEAVWEWVPETGRVVGGPRMANLLGEGINQGLPWMDFVHPEDRMRLAQGFLRAVEAGARVWTAECRVKGVDGAWIRVINRGVLVRDEAQRLVRVVGAIQDLSEREELRTRLAQSDRLASVGTLAAGVAHEINNPLAYVIANLDFAREELRASGAPPADLEPLSQAIDEAREGAERMRLIVQDLKVFSRKDDDRLEWVQLPRALDSAAAMAWNEIRHRARLVKDYQPLPAVYANEARLGQVFLNLLVNAAHAIAEGAAERNEIRLSTRVDETGRIVVEVRDSGRGIPEELRARVFEPFFTTKPLGEGTGLGLPICRDIVARLGGALEFESEVGVGTVFRVLLPGARPEAQPG